MKRDKRKEPSMKTANIKIHLESELDRLTEILAAGASSRIIADKADRERFGNRDEAAVRRLDADNRVALVRHTQEQVLEIQRALEKIENGTYGLCDGCGGIIPPERLEVLPHTCLCLICKTKCPR